MIDESVTNQDPSGVASEAVFLPRIYLAGPFFSPSQIAFISRIEAAFTEAKFPFFSPRHADAAKELNACIKEKLEPSEDLRKRVFRDNTVNIDQANLVVAIIDDRDTGTVWEMGYAFARTVPVITVTQNNYGMNLMLAHSVIGHTKSVEELVQSILTLASLVKDNPFYIALERFKGIYLNSIALSEGPSERVKQG